jgi:hypothetical protein
MDIEVYEHLVIRSVELGIPADISAELFNLPVETIKELQREVRIREFNTDQKEEFVENLQWKALQHADRMLASGSPDQAMKIVNAVFGRQIAVAGKRPSSATEEARERLMSMFEGIRDGTASATRAGRFVLGRTDVERGANRDEDDDDV